MDKSGKKKSPAIKKKTVSVKKEKDKSKVPQPLAAAKEKIKPRVAAKAKIARSVKTVPPPKVSLPAPAAAAARVEPEVTLPAQTQKPSAVPEKTREPIESPAALGERDTLDMHRMPARSGPLGPGGADPAAPETPAAVAAAQIGKEQPAVAVQAKKKLILTPQVTVKELALALGLGVADLIKKLMQLGIWATINQRLEAEVVTLIAGEYGYEVEFPSGFSEDDIELTQKEANGENQPLYLTPRAPIVTIMGHVDHGKTSLLDAIRQTKVVESEAGGITQHIGAYKVPTSKGHVVFLDTPGHEAFTAMRARGAKVTDIVVLVVAADDGVMPQTIEAIDHAQAGGVPIVVAINKIDKPEANPNRVKQELANRGLVAEDWGGKTIMVEVSAKKRQNLDQLLEMLMLEAELLELKADQNKRAVGTVLDARKDSKRGNMATVLVQDGALHVGDPFVCGLTWGKVRALNDEHGEKRPQAGPSSPIIVLGFENVAEAGDRFLVTSSERQAKEVAARRKTEFEAIHGRGRSKHLALEDLHKKIESGEVKELRVVLRTDVQGSLEAIIGELSKLRHEEVVIKVLHSGVGAVNPSDVLLAAASDAIVLAFNTTIEPRAKEEAEKEGVSVQPYKVIYELVEEIRAALEGLLEPIIKESVVGNAVVRALFHVPRFGAIGGCFVEGGKIVREGMARVMRDGVKVFQGKIGSLKRFKEDVPEVASGFECGVSLSGFEGLKKGDRLECFVPVKELKKIVRSS